MSLHDASTTDLRRELKRREVEDAEPELTVGWQPSSKVGSCNFCSRYVRLDPPGIREHQVLVMRGRSIEVRACRRCLDKIKRCS